MNIIFLLMGCSFIIAVGFLVAFIWAHKSGQHMDTYTPSIRILFEDEIMEEEKMGQEKIEAKRY